MFVKGLLRKLTEEYCRYRSHFRFLTVCINEGLIPKGVRVRFATTALPSSEYLHHKVHDVLKEATSSIVLHIRNTYSYRMDTVKRKLDSFFYLYDHFVSRLFYAHEIMLLDGSSTLFTLCFYTCEMSIYAQYT